MLKKIERNKEELIYMTENCLCAEKNSNSRYMNKHVFTRLENRFEENDAVCIKKEKYDNYGRHWEYLLT